MMQNEKNLPKTKELVELNTSDKWPYKLILVTFPFMENFL